MAMYDVYPLLNIVPEKGKGCFVYDDEGREFLDLYGGHAVISIGHSHPHFVKSVSGQLEKLAFYSNSIINPLQELVAGKLMQVSGVEDFKLFMVNSGAEANENALKLASFHNSRTKVAALKGSFHGRTSAAINVTHTGQKHQAPINHGIHVDYFDMNDIEGITGAIGSRQYAAFIMECIQGIGGLDAVKTEATLAIREACDHTDTIMICDEIQCGYGRTGQFFAFQDSGVLPDVITMAKGMGNGFPVGGLLINAHKLPPISGRLGTTFGGNHLACSAALAVLEVIEHEELIQNAAITGEYLLRQLENIPAVKKVKGRGLMLGAEFDFPIAPLREDLVYRNRVFTGTSANPKLLRILPPLNLSNDLVEVFIEKLKDSIDHISQSVKP